MSLVSRIPYLTALSPIIEPTIPIIFSLAEREREGVREREREKEREREIQFRSSSSVSREIESIGRKMLGNLIIPENTNILNICRG